MRFSGWRLLYRIYLVGAGLAEPDGVRVDPFVFVAEPTDKRDGLDGVDVVTRRVGILVCVPSSVEWRARGRWQEGIFH